MTWISNGNNISCHGASDGQVEAVIVGGTAPYIYSWNNGSFTKKITGLSAGTYTFTVTDANNVTANAEVSLLEPDALSLDLVTSNFQGYNISEQGGNDGWVEVKTIGGTPDYAISWTGGGTKERLENLSAGTYSVTVTDRNGCSAVASRTLSEPTPLHVVSITSPVHHGFNVSCTEGKDGAINLSVAGGVAPYTYDWNDGSFEKDRVELAAGLYTVHITDKNDANLEATIQLSEPSSLTITLTPQVYPNGLNLSCHDCANGSMTASGTGGVTPYTYLWNNGQTTVAISGLSDREYGCKITDVNGCIESQALSLYAPDRDDWSMNGNANIDPATQFMGTTDSKDFVFKTNNLERLRIGAGGGLDIANSLRIRNLGSVNTTNIVLADAQGNLTSKIINIGTVAGCNGVTVLPWQQSPTNPADVFSCWRRFGIGTDSPEMSLDVKGDVKISNYLQTTDFMKFGHNGGDATINNFGVGNLLINYTSDVALVPAKKTIINSGLAGDVEIGNVQNSLKINCSTTFEKDVRFASLITPGLLAVNTQGLISSISGGASDLLTGQGFVSSSSLIPWTKNGNDISNNNLGNIGIGTSTLNRLFTVNGICRLGSDDGDYALEILSHGGVPIKRGISLDEDNSGQFNFFINQFQNAASFNFLNNDPSSGIVNLMSIQKNGNVGIGIPATYALNDLDFKLSVNGGIRATKVKVYVYPWPDYVFSKHYNLMPLLELEQFIKENNHLPGIQSAVDIENNGLDLGQAQANVLQKVEELTLYVIELSRQNKLLQSELNKVKTNLIKAR